MIPAERFLVKSEQRPEWLAARTGLVTATMVAEAATPSGFEQVVLKHRTGANLDANEMMQFGTDSELELAMWGKEQFGALPNSWLIAAENPLWAATPDGLTLDHVGLTECKTTGTDWTTPPIKYRRQVQWQLDVCGAEWCELIWNLRVIVNGEYRLGWFEPKHHRFFRDEQMIAELRDTADRLTETLGLAA